MNPDLLERQIIRCEQMMNRCARLGLGDEWVQAYKKLEELKAKRSPEKARELEVMRMRRAMG
jgi:hypothetical protein